MWKYHITGVSNYPNSGRYILTRSRLIIVSNDEELQMQFFNEFGRWESPSNLYAPHPDEYEFPLLFWTKKEAEAGLLAVKL